MVLNPDLREWIVTDYVFVAEYYWRETLTDVVTWNGMHQARKELVNLAIGLWHDAFLELAGADYDDGEFMRWLETDGRAWLNEMLDFAFIHCAAHKGPAAQATLWKELAAICARHGLTFPASANAHGVDRRIVDFLTAQMRRRVHRKKDGQLVDRKTVLEWTTPPKTAQPKAKVRRNELSPLDQSVKKVVERRNGNQSAFDQRLGSLLVRMFGLHWLPAMLTEERLFDYTLTMPGEMADTNGQILSSNQVRWAFDSVNAFPLGYPMEALLSSRNYQRSRNCSPAVRRCLGKRFWTWPRQ